MEKSPEAFRTISELADLLETPAHVLRFWESRFPQIKPVKRAGGRRYYRPADVALIAGIRRLLHDEGLTIRGVQKMLREQGVRHVASFAAEGFLDPAAFDSPEPAEPAPAEVVALAQWREQRKEAEPPAAAVVPQRPRPAKPPQTSLFDAEMPDTAPPVIRAGDDAQHALQGAPEAADSPEAATTEIPAAELPDLPPAAPVQDEADSPIESAAADITESAATAESSSPEEQPQFPWYPPLIRALPRDLPSAQKVALAAVFQRLLALRDQLDEGRGAGRR